MLRIVPDEAGCEELALTLDEICLGGARRMLVAALLAEVDSYVAAASGERDECGHALVTRNGKARARQVVTSAGAIEISAPRVNDRRVDEATGERSHFASSILPPYVRRSPKVNEVLPLLYLHGLSSLDFVPALAEFFGTEAGLSAAAITRLTAPGDAGPGPCRRRRGARVLGSHRRGVPRDAAPTRLGAQDGQRPGLRAKVHAAAGPPGHRRDHERGEQGRGGARRRSVWCRVRGALAQGRGQDPLRPRGPGGVLRLPGRALGTPADLQPDRVDVCNGEGANEPHEGTGLEAGRPGHGVQAPSGRRREVEKGQRPRARGARSCRGDVRQRQAGGKKRGRGRRVITNFRSTTLDDSSSPSPSRS